MPRGQEVVPVRGVMVTLHRVGSDTAGPVDSLRTRADGRFRFDYLPTGAADALYFVSASHAGLAYFSPPLRAVRVTGDDAEITVFDTTSRGWSLTTRGRHVVVSGTAVGAAAGGGSSRRTVIEVFELSNDSMRTIVAGSGKDEHPTWTATLPAGAQGFQVGQGDVSADAVSFTDGRVLVYAPIAPGVKQFSFSYSLPAASFPLSVPAERATQVFEVLLEDPAGTADGGGVRRVDPVTVEGRTFTRYLGQDVPANAVVRIDFPTRGGSSRAFWIVAVALVVGVAMLIGLARAFQRRAVPITAPRLGEDDPEDLARRIATLDAAFEAESEPSEARREGYHRQRAMLKERLTDALARRGRRT